MLDAWKPLIALVATLLLLLWAKRWITRHLQELSMRSVGDPDVALFVYFVVVLPGVALHEVSHFLMALLLGVPVRKLKIGPVRQGRSRRVSLGSVQVGSADPLRSSLIGVAPLLGGSAVILLIGNLVLGVREVAQAMSGQGVEGILAGLRQASRVPGFAMWLYLIFAVSNAMLPSDSDMATVRPVLIFLGIVAGVVLVVAGVPAIPEAVVVAVNAAANYLASAFGLTLVVDAAFMLVMGLSLVIVRRIQGRS